MVKWLYIGILCNNKNIVEMYSIIEKGICYILCEGENWILNSNFFFVRKKKCIYIYRDREVEREKKNGYIYI